MADFDPQSPVTCFDLITEGDKKVLIVTDHHIGKMDRNYEAGVEKTVEQIKKYVSLTNPDFVVDLGDIFDGGHYFPSEYYFYIYELFFSKLDVLPLDVHVIPGNHDRCKMLSTHRFPPYRHVLYHDVDIIRWFYDRENKCDPILFAHDLHSFIHLEIQDHSNFIKFLKSRIVESGIAQPSSTLIIGHTHHFCVNAACRGFSVGRCTVDRKHCSACAVSFVSNRDKDKEKDFEETSSGQAESSDSIKLKNIKIDIFEEDECRKELSKLITWIAGVDQERDEDDAAV